MSLGGRIRNTQSARLDTTIAQACLVAHRAALVLLETDVGGGRW
jgi:hypothetical protein